MKRLMQMSERQGSTWYAYHSTAAKNIDSIKQQGITTNGGYISMGGTYAGAEEWGYLKGEDFIVLKIQLTAKDLDQIKKSTSEWKEFFDDYFINTIAPQNDYDVSDVKNGKETLDDFIQTIKKYDGEDHYLKLENQVFEEFFNNYEININYNIPANQIIEISNVTTV